MLRQKQQPKKKKYMHLCLLQHYLQQPRHGSNLNVHQQRSGYRCGTHLETAIQSEVKSEKDKYVIIYMCNLEKW